MNLCRWALRFRWRLQPLQELVLLNSSHIWTNLSSYFLDMQFVAPAPATVPRTPVHAVGYPTLPRRPLCDHSWQGRENTSLQVFCLYKTGVNPAARFPNCYNIETYCLGHRDFVTSLSLLSESLLVSGSGDGSVRLWRWAWLSNQWFLAHGA